MELKISKKDTGGMEILTNLANEIGYINFLIAID